MRQDHVGQDAKTVSNAAGPSVFFISDAYAEKRLILNNNLKYPFHRLFGKSNDRNVDVSLLHDHEVRFNAPANTPCLLHTFNTINMGSMPFLTHFETELPWWASYERVKSNKEQFIRGGLQQIAGNSCVGICALSDDARKRQYAFVRNNGLDSAAIEAIDKKCVTLYPPQKILAKNIERFDHVDKVKFIFVGGYFFLKGGIEILDALCDLRRKYRNFELTVISTLAIVPNWNVLFITEDEIRKTLEILTKTEWITWHNGLPNKDVLQLLNEHHVGLLPSYQETFGYAVLEEQAAGLPVITTDIRAFPETNNTRIGYVVNMPNRSAIEPGTDRATVSAHRKILRLRLAAIFEDILACPAQLAEKSRLAMQRIREMHDPAAYAQRIDELYRTCLAPQ